MIDQADKLREFFASGAKALILFDACRYDMFEEVCSEYLRGKLLKVWNGGYTFTYDWFAAHCRGKLNCTFYTPFPTMWKGYDPRKHFKRVIRWQDIAFDYERGTTTPQMVNRMVFAKPDDKMFVHYLQPHPPFIGNPPMPWTRGGKLVNKTKNRLTSGEITIEKLREAYKGNIRVAFEGAVELVNRLGGDIYITSDHGEALGEKGYFYHARSYQNLPCLCHVPWFEVGGLR